MAIRIVVYYLLVLWLSSSFSIGGYDHEDSHGHSSGRLPIQLQLGISTEDSVIMCERLFCLYKNKGFQYVYNMAEQFCKQGFLAYNDCAFELKEFKGTAEAILSKLQGSYSETCRFMIRGAKYTFSQYVWDIPLNITAYPIVKHTPTQNFSVLHLTDTHMYVDYVIKGKGGPFGDMSGRSRSGPPVRTIKSLLKNAASRKPDYIYLTGDYMPNNASKYTYERIIREIRRVTEMISTNFNGVHVVPAIGNHDTIPVYQFPSAAMNPGKYSVSRLYKDLWNIWKKWIPKDQERIFKKGGFYSIRIRPGLRVFSLNTQFCYILNYWLAINPRDPEDQLKWLIGELQKSANRGEKAHIIGHIPPGTTECLNEWAKVYKKVVARFRNVITGQFFGHQHWDQFMVYFEPNTLIPTGVQFAGPSATTYMTGYPSYRIMHFGRNTELLDMDTYLLNITTLNNKFMATVKKNSTQHLEAKLKILDNNDTSYEHWQLAYSMKKQYSMKDLSPKSFAVLMVRLISNDTLLKTYFKSYFQHRNELDNATCHLGVCNDTFLNPGAQRPLVSEMFAQGK